jgi:hypothetical protein
MTSEIRFKALQQQIESLSTVVNTSHKYIEHIYSNMENNQTRIATLAAQTAIKIHTSECPARSHLVALINDVGTLKGETQNKTKWNALTALFIKVLPFIIAVITGGGTITAINALAQDNTPASMAS